MNIIALRALNEKADKLINFAYYDEEEEKPNGFAKAAIGIGALGAGGAGYLYRDKIGAMGQRAGAYASGMASDVKGAVANSGVGQAFTKGMDRAAYAGEGKLASLLRGLRGAARTATKGRSKMVGLSSRHAQLVQLNARLDEVINFYAISDISDQPGGWKRGLWGVLAAQKGRKLEATGDILKEQLKYQGAGAGAGAGIGAAIGAVSGGRAKAKLGAMMGGGAGLLIGGAAAPGVNARRYDKYFQQ